MTGCVWVHIPTDLPSFPFWPEALGNCETLKPPSQPRAMTANMNLAKVNMSTSSTTHPPCKYLFLRAVLAVRVLNVVLSYELTTVVRFMIKNYVWVVVIQLHWVQVLSLFLPLHLTYGLMNWLTLCDRLAEWTKLRKMSCLGVCQNKIIIFLYVLRISRTTNKAVKSDLWSWISAWTIWDPITTW